MIDPRVRVRVIVTVLGLGLRLAPGFRCKLKMYPKAYICASLRYNLRLIFVGSGASLRYSLRLIFGKLKI